MVGHTGGVIGSACATAVPGALWALEFKTLAAEHVLKHFFCQARKPGRTSIPRTRKANVPVGANTTVFNENHMICKGNCLVNIMCYQHHGKRRL